MALLEEKKWIRRSRPSDGFVVRRVLETYSFLTEHARTKTYISKKRLTLVGKYSHAASEVALLRTPLKNARPSSSHMQTSVEQAGGSAAERRVRPGGARRRAEIGCTCVEASDQTNTGGESEAQLETRDLWSPGVSPAIASQSDRRSRMHAADTHAPSRSSRSRGLSRGEGTGGRG